MAAATKISAGLRGEGSEHALRAVRAAGRAVDTAKSTRSNVLIDGALRDLQAAVDTARDRGVAWGHIGSALGLARGNAYQRYRKKAPRSEFVGRADSRDAARASA